MTPKDKAQELVDKYYTTLLPNVRMRKPIAIQHALIAVDEIINSGDKNIWGVPSPSLAYWQEVKNEILKKQNT